MLTHNAPFTSTPMMDPWQPRMDGLGFDATAAQQRNWTHFVVVMFYYKSFLIVTYREEEAPDVQNAVSKALYHYICSWK